MATVNVINKTKSTSAFHDDSGKLIEVSPGHEIKNVKISDAALKAIKACSNLHFENVGDGAKGSSQSDANLEAKLASAGEALKEQEQLIKELQEKNQALVEQVEELSLFKLDAEEKIAAFEKAASEKAADESQSSSETKKADDIPSLTKPSKK